jgi:predicted metalloprotease with PDZ domain
MVNVRKIYINIKNKQNYYNIINNMHYTIQLNLKHNNCLDVVLKIPYNWVQKEMGLHLYMPRYIPGSYMMRDFAKHIIHIETKQTHVNLIKKNIDSWYIEINNSKHNNNENCTDDICIEYTLWCSDLSVRGNYVDDTRMFINGAATFLYAKEYMQHDVHIDLKNINFAPQTFTTLQQLQPLQFKAKSYDELIDHPILIIKDESKKSDISTMHSPRHISYISNQNINVEEESKIKPTYALVLHGDVLNNVNIKKISADIQKICTAQDVFFNCVDEKKAKHTDFNYLFMVHVMQNNYGGLEHCAGTALACSPEHLNTDITHKNSKYLEFLGLCSHEYFHSWWVKRVKPQAFIQTTMQAEIDTSLLWLFEGFTSYYDDLFLHKAGIIDKHQYIELLQKSINMVYAYSGHYQQSLHDASIDAWIKYYQPHSNSQNTYVSYYAKGALVALCLDLHLRIYSQYTFSLDDVMQFIFNRYGRNFFAQLKTKTQHGITYQNFVDSIKECTGIDASEVLNQWIMYTDTQHELPFIDYLQHFGISCNKEISYDADWRIQYNQNNQTILIDKVYENGLAYKANLMVGDILLAVNDIMILPQHPNEIFDRIGVVYGHTSDHPIYDKKNIKYLNTVPKCIEILYIRNRQIRRTMLEYQGTKKEKIILKIEKYINFKASNPWLS